MHISKGIRFKKLALTFYVIETRDLIGFGLGKGLNWWDGGDEYFYYDIKGFRIEFSLFWINICFIIGIIEKKPKSLN